MVKQKTIPRAFSARGQWKYSQRRNDRRVEQARHGMRTLARMVRAGDTVYWWVMRRLGVHPWEPPEIDKHHFHVEDSK